MKSQSHFNDNKRLAKNTLTLFLRTFFVMLVGLYVSRVLLQVLGIDDFGIYNVVGGIVVLFSFLNSAMSSSSQRYITYSLGFGDRIETNKVFSASMGAQIFIALLLFIFVELLGFWLINTKLHIPETRMLAANVAFQFSVLTFCTNIIKVPYEASVIAYEKMSIYAVVSILDVLLKLAIVIILQMLESDKLIIYSSFLFISNIITLIFYVIYCKRNFSTCKFYIVKDYSLYGKLFSFTGWSLLGSCSNVLTQQGFVFMLNIFYGVVVNAAMGIANQVNSSMTTFINSFQISYRPQIVKSYALQDYNHINNLVHVTSKMSFSLIIIPVLILLFNMPLVLDLWLVDMPEYSIQFCQMILICTTIDAMSGSYNAAITATGRIRNYQIAISISFILDIVVSYILIKSGIPPYFILISRVLTRGVLNMAIGIYYLKSLLDFNVCNYLKMVVLRFILVLVIILPLLCVFYSRYSSWNMLVISTIYILTVGPILIIFILFEQKERLYIKNLIKTFMPIKKYDEI